MVGQILTKINDSNIKTKPMNLPKIKTFLIEIYEVLKRFIHFKDWPLRLCNVDGGQLSLGQYVHSVLCNEDSVFKLCGPAVVNTDRRPAVLQDTNIPTTRRQDRL